MSQTEIMMAADVGERFAAEGLPAPPVPMPLGRDLRQWDDWVFATVEPVHSPWNVETYLEVALAETAPLLLIAHAGYGISSAAIHYFLVWDGLALFLQVPWGGVYTDDDAAVDTLRTRFAQIQALIERSPAALAAGERLLVVDTNGERTWARFRAESGAEMDRQRARDPFEAALASLGR